MLSAFLKKLIFARQFFMMNGKIELLGKNQVMLPLDLILKICPANDKKNYTLVKKLVKDVMMEYAKKVGATSEGMSVVAKDIFETFGLGKLEVVDLNMKEKKTYIKVIHPDKGLYSSNKGNYSLQSAALAGIFSFLFGKEVDVKSCTSKKISNSCEIIIK